MRQICKNCDYFHQSYKRYVCAFHLRIGTGDMKKVSANGSCQHWKEKKN